MPLPKLAPTAIPRVSTGVTVAQDWRTSMQIPDQFRYTPDQIRDMLMRGQSETMERSGESDSGLPPASAAEAEANAREATKQYGIDVRAGAVPPPVSETPNLLPLAALAAFLIFGG